MPLSGKGQARQSRQPVTSCGIVKDRIVPFYLARLKWRVSL